MSRRTRYAVRVTNKLKTVHQEFPTDDRREAEQYCRDAIADGCPTAVVISTANGHTVSWWDAAEVELWELQAPTRR